MLIVGLGNPGARYEGTYHNLGFEAADRIADALQIRIKDGKCAALCGETYTGGKKVVVAKPQTYMNLSGESVRSLLAHYRMRPQETIILYDDIDIPIGTLRARKEGSAGTHNGMRNIIAETGTQAFLRIRIGAGHDTGGAELKDVVLSRVSSAYAEAVDRALGTAAEAVVQFVRDGDFDALMRKCNVLRP